MASFEVSTEPGTDEAKKGEQVMTDVAVEQQQWWWFGELATLKVASSGTNGGFSMVEILAPGGLAVPTHVHELEDETFVMLEGSADFVVGRQHLTARSGDVLFGPRGVPHSYVVGPEGARMLFCFNPGSNMESFIAASAVPALDATLPPPEVVPPPPSVLDPILTAHGLRFVP